MKKKNYKTNKLGELKEARNIKDQNNSRGIYLSTEVHGFRKSANERSKKFTNHGGNCDTLRKEVA